MDSDTILFIYQSLGIFKYVFESEWATVFECMFINVCIPACVSVIVCICRVGIKIDFLIYVPILDTQSGIAEANFHLVG